MVIVTLICVLTSAKERGVEKKTTRELKRREKAVGIGVVELK